MKVHGRDRCGATPSGNVAASARSPRTDAAAAIGWATFAALLGYVGGSTFEDDPWKGLVAALAISFSIAGATELVRWYRKRRKGRAA